MLQPSLEFGQTTMVHSPESVRGALETRASALCLTGSTAHIMVPHTVHCAGGGDLVAGCEYQGLRIIYLLSFYVAMGFLQLSYISSPQK